MGKETRNENGMRNEVERFRLQETRREKNSKTEGSQNCNEQIQKFRYNEKLFYFQKPSDTNYTQLMLVLNCLIEVALLN